MQRSIPFLWGLVIILLILNLILLDTLNLARITAIETLGEAETMLDSLTDEVIVYNIEVNQAMPVSMDIPFNRTVEIPFKTVVPVDQVVTVPFQTPAGEVVLDVPVRVDIPIDVVVPVEFNQALNVETVVELNTTLPVEIDITQTPLASHLEEAKMNIARLRNRLALKGDLATEKETIPAEPPESEKSAGIAEASVGDSRSPAISVESVGITAPAQELETEPGASEILQDPATNLTLLSENLDSQATLGLCAHPYWPLWPGTSWTYNSQDSSFTQHLNDVSNNQVFMSTQYEGRDILFSLVCSEDGLGGNFLGDMRRISELGDLEFSNPRGTFLPSPEAMEERRPWTQELDVTGTVRASQGDRLVEGRISRGRAIAFYTPVRYETVATPLGPREAWRVEQRLDLELGIDFDLDGQTIPGTEIVNLNAVYWFAKDIGLVKMNWQGGTIQQSAVIGQTPVNQQSSVPGLAQDELVFVCVTLEDQPVRCAEMDGFSRSDLKTPPESELAVQGFVFPNAVAGADGAGVAGPGASPSPAKPAEDRNEQSDLLAYARAVEGLSEQISEAAREFWQSALAYQDGELTLDEFQSEFSEVASQVREVIQAINQLSAPSKVETLHRKLTNGIAQCDQAIGLMDDWFDDPDSGAEQAAALLVAECIEDVTAVSEELMTIVGQD